MKTLDTVETYAVPGQHVDYEWPDIDCDAIAKELLPHVECDYEEWLSREQSKIDNALEEGLSYGIIPTYSTYGEWLKSPMGYWNHFHPLQLLETKIEQVIDDESSVDYDRARVDDEYDNQWRECKCEQFDSIMKIILSTPIQ